MCVCVCAHNDIGEGRGMWLKGGYTCVLCICAYMPVDYLAYKAYARMCVPISLLLHVFQCPSKPHALTLMRDIYPFTPGVASAFRWMSCWSAQTRFTFLTNSLIFSNKNSNTRRCVRTTHPRHHTHTHTHTRTRTHTHPTVSLRRCTC